MSWGIIKNYNSFLTYLRCKIIKNANKHFAIYKTNRFI